MGAWNSSLPQGILLQIAGHVRTSPLWHFFDSVHQSCHCSWIKWAKCAASSQLMYFRGILLLQWRCQYSVFPLQKNLTFICNMLITARSNSTSIPYCNLPVKIPVHLANRSWVSSINPLVFIDVIIIFILLPVEGVSSCRNISLSSIMDSVYCWNILSAAQEPQVTLKNDSFLGPK